jgi:DNA-binding MarR family transcriptional regulator
MSAEQFRSSLTDDERKGLATLLNALEPFFGERQTMPMQLVKSFILAALHEGEGVTELAKRAGLSQSVMSRHLLDIGDRNRHMEAGFGWTTQHTDPMELRKHRVVLTPKGTALAHKVLRALFGGKR